MRFDTYIPCDILKPYVRAFVISESTEEKQYKVLPGTELVIGFQYSGSLTQIKNEEQVKLSTAGLTGLHNKFRVFKNAANTGTVLVYFKEAGATAFFKQPIHELFEESVSLDNFMLRSELLIFEQQLSAAGKDADKIDVVEHFLITRMNNTVPDKLVLAALGLIHKAKGDIKIKDLAQQLLTSASPLEKRFRQAVGASPKKFAAIVRFKHTIQNYSSASSLTDLGYEAGFYDQAHFIKSFKEFTGETPESFFSAR